MAKHRRRKADIKKGLRVTGFGYQIPVGDAIADYASKSDNARLVGLPHNRRLLLTWSGYLVNSRGRDFPAVVNAFLKYAGAQKHPALLVDMALALLVVRGYEYDALKGRYNLNKVGRQLLEYAIAHPIPRTVELAQVLKERWDEQAVLKMIQKYHPDAATWEQFERKVRAAK